MIIAAHIPIKPQASLTDNDAHSRFLRQGRRRRVACHAALLSESDPVDRGTSSRERGYRRNRIMPSDCKDHPERSFWEVETASLRDFPQQLRTFEIRRNSDNTISIITTDVDPAVRPGSPAAKSRGYAIGVARIFGATPAMLADATSHAYNAELVKQLSPEMQAKIARCGSPIESPSH